ncbi:MAG: hypothetical protein ABSE72_03155, partial [Bacteroidales bacterium]
NKTSESDLPDIVHRFKTRNEKTDTDRKSNFFFVGKKEIVEKDYDLNLTTYKEEEYIEEIYEKPEVILKQLSTIETTIFKGLEELTELVK